MLTMCHTCVGIVHSGGQSDYAHMDEDMDLEHRIAERSIGCKIEDLKFVVPMTTLPLGGTFWKNGKDTVLCDMDADSVLTSVRLLFSFPSEPRQLFCRQHQLTSRFCLLIGTVCKRGRSAGACAEGDRDSGRIYSVHETDRPNLHADNEAATNRKAPFCTHF